MENEMEIEFGQIDEIDLSCDNFAGEFAEYLSTQFASEENLYFLQPYEFAMQEGSAEMISQLVYISDPDTSTEVAAPLPLCVIVRVNKDQILADAGVIPQNQPETDNDLMMGTPTSGLAQLAGYPFGEESIVAPAEPEEHSNTMEENLGSYCPYTVRQSSGKYVTKLRSLTLNIYFEGVEKVEPKSEEKICEICEVNTL